MVLTLRLVYLAMCLIVYVFKLSYFILTVAFMALDSAKRQIVCIRKKCSYVAYHGCPSDKTQVELFGSVKRIVGLWSSNVVYYTSPRCLSDSGNRHF